MSRIMAIYDNLTIQAKIALLAGVITFLNALVRMDYSRITTGKLVGLFVVVLTMLFWPYAIDCYSKGQCEILAWVASSLLLASSLMLITK